MPMLMLLDVQSVQTLFAYDRWANRLILEAAGELPPEDLGRDLEGSFGSIQGTLRHLLWGERAWLGFWTRGAFCPALAPEDYPDLPAIVAAWAALEAEQEAFARELTNARLAADCPVAEVVDRALHALADELHRPDLSGPGGS